MKAKTAEKKSRRDEVATTDFGPNANAPDEENPARTPHPIPGGPDEKGAEPEEIARQSFGPNANAPDEENPARTPHPVPGGGGPQDRRQDT